MQLFAVGLSYEIDTPMQTSTLPEAKLPRDGLVILLLLELVCALSHTNAISQVFLI